MKQLLTTLLFLLLAGPLAAQQGLAVNELFSGNIIPRERMVETRVRGRMLTDYKMSLFRSVKCKVSKEELEKINAAVHRDMTSYKTTECIGDERHGRSSTLMVQLAAKGKYLLLYLPEGGSRGQTVGGHRHLYREHGENHYRTEENV